MYIPTNHLLRNHPQENLVSSHKDLKIIISKLDKLHPEAIKCTDNLFIEKSHALKYLQSNRDITIKNADKGGATIVTATHFVEIPLSKRDI